MSNNNSREQMGKHSSSILNEDSSGIASLLKPITDFDQSGFIKGKITTAQGIKTNSLDKCKNLYFSKIKGYKNTLIKTYTNKKVVINRALANHNRNSFKVKILKPINIQDVNIDDLYLGETLVNKGKEGNTFKGDALHAATELNDSKKRSEMNDEFMRSYRQKIMDTMWRKVAFNINDITAPNATIGEELNMNGCLSTENKTKEFPLDESFMVGSVERMRNLEELIDIDIKKEETVDIEVQNAVINENKRRRGLPHRVVNNISEDTAGYFNEPNPQVFCCTDQQLDLLYPEEIKDTDDIKKEEKSICGCVENLYDADFIKEENTTFLEENKFNQVRAVNSFDDKDCNMVYCKSLSEHSRKNSVWKEELVNKKVYQQIICDSTTHKKLNASIDSLIEIKSEIKSEPLQECFEGHVLTISCEPVQELKSTVNVVGETEIKIESNEMVLEEESSVTDDSLKFVTGDQKALQCGLPGYEPCVSGNGSILDKQLELFLNTEHVHKFDCINSNFMKCEHACSLCTKSFRNLMHYYNHFIYHNLNKFQCPYCKVVTDRKNFYLHCFVHVTKNYFNCLTTDKSLTMECKQCNEKVQEQRFLTHYERHSLVDIDPKVVKFPKFLLDEVIKNLRIHENLCVLCEVRFKRPKRHLVEHLYADASSNKVKNSGLLCQLCKRRACDKATYKKHMLRHATLATYECKICKKLYSRSGFINHQRRHTSTSVWCDICKVELGTFVSKEEVLSHLRIKHPLREMMYPIKSLHCEKCELMFDSKSLLNNHAKLFHEENKVLSLITYSRPTKSGNTRPISKNAAPTSEGSHIHCMRERESICKEEEKYQDWDQRS